MRILVFGDSIAHGFYDSKGGWVQRLANDLHIKTLESMKTADDFNVQVINLGVSGDTTVAVLDRIQAETDARQVDDGEVIVLAVGTNDAILQQNLANMDVYEFEEVYDELVAEAQKLTPNVVCVGLPAVDESLSDPWKFSSSGKQFKNNRLNLFEDTIKQVAERKDLPFIPVFDAFEAALKSGRGLLADGLHPNDAGHEFIYKIVKPKLEELFI